jgi:putative ATP-dependent endonuclease of OLD family
MRLASLRIQNLRPIANASVVFDSYTCLVGANGAGKSTILTALNILFRNTVDAPTDLLALGEEDFHKGDTSTPITITAQFSDLEKQAQEDFAHYVRQGVLVMSARATWEPREQRAIVKQFGQRLVMRQFAPFFEATEAGKPVSDLREIYAKLREQVTDLPAATTKAGMTSALRDHEEAHPEACELQESAADFYGVSKGKNLLEKYIQWVHVPAVKDASSEQIEGKKTALGALLERVVRSKVSFTQELEEIKDEARGKYAQLLKKQAEVLQELSGTLNTRLQEWAHPGASLSLVWREHPEAVKVEEPLAKVRAGEGPFEGDLARCGHGLQRSYLLALLQELAGVGGDAPRLILGCEEPELYQHPPQQRHLAEVLERLAEGNSQVVVSTHSPYFVSGKGFEAVRVVRKDPDNHATTVSMASFNDVATSISRVSGEVVSASALPPRVHSVLRPSLNEMFFAPVVVLVEGIEDVAYLATYMELSGLWEEYRRLGCHLVPVGGKSHLVQTVAITDGLNIPTFVVFDADADEDDPGKRAKHEKDNRAILRLCGCGEADPLPDKNFAAPGVVMWSSKISEVVHGELGPTVAELRDGVLAKYRFYGRGSLEKNEMYIGYFLAEAWSEGLRSPSLEQACKSILGFAEVRKSGQLVAAA